MVFHCYEQNSFYLYQKLKEITSDICSEMNMNIRDILIRDMLGSAITKVERQCQVVEDILLVTKESYSLRQLL